MGLRLDADGYLEQLADWNEQVASELAQLENIELTTAHWELISLVRKYHTEFEHAPAMRPLVKWVKLEAGVDKGNSIYLHKLFPTSPAKQLARVAGLPKPTKCL